MGDTGTTESALPRKGWPIVVGLFIGVAGLAQGFFFYYDSIKVRDPVAFIDPDHLEIVSSRKVKPMPITVHRISGERIDRDVWISRFYFWNDGKEPIRPASGDVRQPIEVCVGGHSTVIESRTLRVNHNSAGIRLVPSAKNPTQCAEIRFDVLQHEDGIAGQLLIEGDVTSTVTVSGETVDAPTIRSVDLSRPLDEHHERLPYQIALGLLIVSIVLSVVKWKDTPEKATQDLMTVFGGSKVAIAISIAGGILIWGLVMRSAFPTSRATPVPESLRSEQATNQP